MYVTNIRAPAASVANDYPNTTGERLQLYRPSAREGYAERLRIQSDSARHYLPARRARDKHR